MVLVSIHEVIGIVSRIPSRRCIVLRCSINVYLCFGDVMQRYKYCIVPQCKNTTRSTPDKLFFSVPTGEKRIEWCMVIGRIPGKHKTLSPRCNRFICEDHFNLQEDMENYMMWRTIGVGKLMLKRGVLPHKFVNQQLNIMKSNTVSARALVTTEIKDEYIKEQNNGNINIYKRNDHETQQNLKYEIKEEISDTVSENRNIIVKKEVDEMETYVFNVHYDSDTGAEYLIDIPKIVK